MRLDRDAMTPAEKRVEKMAKKRRFNEERHYHRKADLKQTGNDKIIMSLSKWHPDYGMTRAQHEAQKAKRLSGEVKFVPKEELRIKRGGLARSFGL